jgi:hypothetical protein
MKSRLNPKAKTRRERPMAQILAPDGVAFEIDWGKFNPGDSVFVPCIDMVEATAQFNELAQNRGWLVEHRCRFESGFSGVRFWRIA